MAQIETDLGLININATGDYKSNYYCNAHAIIIDDTDTAKRYLKVTGKWYSCGNNASAQVKQFSTNINVGAQVSQVNFSCNCFYNTKKDNTEGVTRYGTYPGYVATDGTLWLSIAHENRYRTFNQYDYDNTIITLNPVMKTITGYINPEGAGTIPAAGAHAIGSSISLEAVPNGGFEFTDWSLHGYTRLEYIESTGTQYIDTGVIPTTNTGVNTEYEWTNATQTEYAKLCGVRNQNNNAYRYFPVSLYSTNAYVEQHIIGSQAINLTSTALHHELIFNDKNRNVYVDGELIGTLNQTLSAMTRTMWIFAANSESTTKWLGKLKLYNFSIYEGTEILRNFIPVIRHSDGAIGLLDLVNLKFYGNSGTGEFIGGNII